jgi:hypothetical protein
MAWHIEIEGKHHRRINKKFRCSEAHAKEKREEKGQGSQ